MEYEFRVWNKPDKMPKVEPHAAPGRLEALKSAILEDANKGNPDIIIDTNKLGEGTIDSAKVSYSTVQTEYKVDTLDSNGRLIPKGLTLPQRILKMTISGNLYLPPDTSVMDTAKSLVGSQGVENAKRNTVLLSQWAAAKPTDVPTQQNKNVEQPYYRAIILSIMTKAGDFRVITANNMYVESYEEDYTEGEFGKFKLSLMQKFDENSEFTVKGLASESVSTLSKIAKGVATAASAVVTAAAVGGTIVKTTTETVEKFTGETDATRKIKGVASATSSAAKTTKDAATLAKDAKNKNYSKLSEDAENLSNSGNDLVRKSKSAHGNKALSLSQMEEEYLDWIKAEPADYEKYLTASDSEKRKMLEQAAKEKQDRWYVTKYYEESAIDMEKVKKTEEDIEKQKSEQAAKSSADNPPPVQNNPAVTNNNVSISGANLTDMLNNAATKKNGISQ